MTTLETLILIGGLLHFGVLIASALVPQVLNWRSELAKLHPLSRQLIWTHGVFIVLVIISFGVLSLINAEGLVTGTLLARSVCAFIALFWLSRLAIQFFVFDAKPFLTNTWLKCGYHGLTLVFIYFSTVYGYTAVAPTA